MPRQGAAPCTELLQALRGRKVTSDSQTDLPNTPKAGIYVIRNWDSTNSWGLLSQRIDQTSSTWGLATQQWVIDFSRPRKGGPWPSWPLPEAGRVEVSPTLLAAPDFRSGRGQRSGYTPVVVKPQPLDLTFRGLSYVLKTIVCSWFPTINGE